MDAASLISLALIVLCLFGLSWFAGSDAPYIPTKLDEVAGVLKTAGIGKGKIFYELGSGDGRVVFEAARLGAHAYGVEESWIRVWLSRLKATRNNIKRAIFFHGNIFDRSYFPADVVYIYLLPIGIRKLEKKLQNELKKGSVVITQKYHFQTWKPFKRIGQFNFYRM